MTLLTTLAACTGSPAPDEAAKSPKLASVQFGLAATSLANLSVAICGERQAPAGSTFNCASTLPPLDGATDAGLPTNCNCYNFDTDGNLIMPGGGPAIANGLCPSTVTPVSDWQFDYSIYSQADCGGEVLNGEGSDFECFDSKDLLSQQHPNQSIEPLEAGLNTNHIVCALSTAAKTWNFESCADISSAAEIAAGTSRYDCDCSPPDAGSGCSCGSDGVTMTDLESGCGFETGTCDIVCMAP